MRHSDERWADANMLDDTNHIVDSYSMRKQIQMSVGSKSYLFGRKNMSSVGSIDVRNTYLYHPKHILLPPESNCILFGNQC
jgi:hypothetical protein